MRMLCGVNQSVAIVCDSDRRASLCAGYSRQHGRSAHMDGSKNQKTYDQPESLLQQHVLFRMDGSRGAVQCGLEQVPVACDLVRSLLPPRIVERLQNPRAA